MAYLTRDNIQQIRSVVREETADIRQEITHIGGLMESLEHQFQAVAEAVSESLRLIRRIDDHARRITDLEADNRLTKRLISLHSHQLKSLTGEQTS
jgi:hypothetical protein